MLGDAYDLSQIIDWASKKFWGEDALDEDGVCLGEWPYPEEVCLEAAALLADLCRAFDGAELAHRKEHSLTGNKTEIKVSL